ncbi:MAG: carboxylesterase family protein [Syntrophobacterales bacterium]|jgi:para-nitrobenzyl esterase|nr:carboxylesterase family protein [Syntrophobacterales bacterium]
MIRILKSTAILLLATLLLGSGCEDGKRPWSSGAEPVIRLDSGPIVPRRDGVYRGIPFAAPPVGAGRWKPPQPVAPWTEPRRCDAFGPVCPQPHYSGPMSEDCLFLNVWTPAKRDGERLPVMVWFHGGAFISGSGSDELYDGAPLAGHGVVVVTCNYRLGVLGFLAHPLLSAESPDRVSGNYGLLDQVAALDWVRRNIAKFGGDPGNVTIFGQSAGAASVCLLMVNPLAKGLFHAAIAQSPAMVGMLRPLRQEQLGVAPAETVGLRLVQELGLDRARDMLSNLRQVPWAKLNAAAAGLETDLGVEVLKLVWVPTVDGTVIPAHPVRLFGQGRRQPVPLITGVTADESTIFLPLIMPQFASPADYQRSLKAMFGEKAAEVERLLPVRSSADLWPRLKQLLSAKWFGAWADYLAATAAYSRQPAWFYRFTRRAPKWAAQVLAEDTGQKQLSAHKLGVAHGTELFSVFGFTKILLGFGPSDWRFSDQVMAYWTNFAKTHRPQSAGLPDWQPYGSQRAYLEFGQEIRPRAPLDVKLYKLIADTWLVSAY